MCEECFSHTDTKCEKCGFITKKNSSNFKEFSLIRSFMRKNLQRILNEISLDTVKEMNNLESKLSFFYSINYQISILN